MTVKFIFDNDIIDMLVFLVLRYHSYMNKKEKKLIKNVNIKRANSNLDQFNEVREKSMRMLTALKEIFQ